MAGCFLYSGNWDPLAKTHVQDRQLVNFPARSACSVSKIGRWVSCLSPCCASHHPPCASGAEDEDCFRRRPLCPQQGGSQGRASGPMGQWASRACDQVFCRMREGFFPPSRGSSRRFFERRVYEPVAFWNEGFMTPGFPGTKKRRTAT